jgi:hypothetical protein
VERVCGIVRAALGAGGEIAAAALQRHRVCGLVLAACRLQDLEPVCIITILNNNNNVLVKAYISKLKYTVLKVITHSDYHWFKTNL